MQNAPLSSHSNFALWTVAVAAALFLSVTAFAEQQRPGDAPIIEGLLDKGDYTEALERLQESSLQTSSKALLLARAYNGLGDWENGVKYAKQATKELPDSVTAQLAYVEALGMKMSNIGRLKAMGSLGTYKKALAKARTLEPRNVDARSEEIGFLFNAPGFVGGSVSKARELIEELRAIDAKQALQMEVQLEDSEENVEAALSAQTKLLALDPHKLNLQNDLAMRLQRAERFADADAIFLRLAEEKGSPWSLGAVYQLGRSRVLGAFELVEAVQYFEDYIQRYSSFDQAEHKEAGLPPVAAAHWRKGLAFQLQGLKSDARAAYQTALRLEPDFSQAKESLKNL